MTVLIPCGLLSGFWVVIIIVVKASWKKGVQKTRGEFPTQVKTHWLEVPLKIKYDPLLVFLLVQRSTEFYIRAGIRPRTRRPGRSGDCRSDARV